MKRFVTYLYECDRGNKSKNVGFIRANVRGTETRIEVYIRNYVRSHDAGKIFAILYNEETSNKKELVGLEIGEVEIQNTQADCHIVFETEHILDSLFSLDDIVGIGICLESGGYIASCWKDAYDDEIVHEEFLISSEKIESTESVEKGEELNVAEEPDFNHNEDFGEMTTYEKIDLSQIRELPSPNWHFATNSFLVHGFWNYGYLVVKEEVEKGQKKRSLGIPGVFEKPEAVMAVLFGFPSFEEIPQEMEKMEMNQSKDFMLKEKNQEAEVGTFGCWFVSLRE